MSLTFFAGLTLGILGGLLLADALRAYTRRNR